LGSIFRTGKNKNKQTNKKTELPNMAGEQNWGGEEDLTSEQLE
jgi:hypothetical protein